MLRNLHLKYEDSDRSQYTSRNISASDFVAEICKKNNGDHRKNIPELIMNTSIIHTSGHYRENI